MAKKHVAAIVKIQIPAGAATPAPPVGTALGPHGVNIMDFCKMYNAQTGKSTGHDRPRRHHDLRGPVVHVRHQDAPDAGAAARRGRARKGRTDDRARDRGHHHQRAARPRRPDEDARPQRQRPRSGQEAGERARPRGPWGSRSADDAQGKEVHRRCRHSTANHSTRPPRPIDLLKSVAAAKFDETVDLAVRLGVDPEGRPDRPRHRAPARGTGKRFGSRCSPPARAAEPSDAAPTPWAPTTWSRRCRAASSTSTSPSPPPT